MMTHKIPVFSLAPIGIIHSPHRELAGMPVQPSGAKGIKGTVAIRDEYAAGLKDIGGFSRLILIYALHRANGYALEVVPFLDDKPHGIFATRSPKRPNAIGVSVVRLIAVNDNELAIEDVDILDGTPLLDIKPYVPAFDSFPDEDAGWFDCCCHAVESARSDKRFL